MPKHAGPKLLCAEPPLAPQLLRDLLMRDARARLQFMEPLVDFGDDVQVVEDVFERALVGETIEKGTHCLFGFHSALHHPKHSQRCAELPRLSRPNGLVLQLPGPGLRAHPKAAECDAQTVPGPLGTPAGARAAASTCWPALG